MCLNKKCEYSIAKNTRGPKRKSEDEVRNGFANSEVPTGGPKNGRSTSKHQSLFFGNVCIPLQGAQEIPNEGLKMRSEMDSRIPKSQPEVRRMVVQLKHITDFSLEMY